MVSRYAHGGAVNSEEEKARTLDIWVDWLDTFCQHFDMGLVTIASTIGIASSLVPPTMGHGILEAGAFGLLAVLYLNNCRFATVAVHLGLFNFVGIILVVLPDRE